MSLRLLQLRQFHASACIFGASRRPITSKNGNKNFYKGTRSGKMGIWSRKGHFITQKWRLREWVVGMDDKLDLRPFVSPKVNENLSTAASIPPHSVLDYFTDFNRPDHVNEQLWDRCRERASQVAGSR